MIKKCLSVIMYNMRILDLPIKRAELGKSKVVFDEAMIKGVVDINRSILAIDAELHADLEKMLIDDGSRQDDLWGINLWYEEGDELIEFDSMINVRPRQNNHTRGVEDPAKREAITQVVAKWIL